MTSPPRAKPFVTQMRRGQLPASSCRHQHVDGHHRQSGRNAFPSGITPIKHHVAGPKPTHGSWTEIRLGARAHKQTQHDTPQFPPRRAERRTSRRHPRSTTSTGPGLGWKLQPGGLDKDRLHR